MEHAVTETTEPTGLDFSAVTLDMAMGALADVVEEAGLDFVYVPTVQLPDTCSYVHHDDPDDAPRAGCIVGQALRRLGATFEQLEWHEGQRALNLPGLPDATAGVLQAAQDVQDNAVARRPKHPPHFTWGHALLAAHKEAICDHPDDYACRERVLAVLGPLAP